jgi:hypothetical protein
MFTSRYVEWNVMRQYKPLALFAFMLWLPVALIGIAEAAKTPKPDYALQSDLDVVTTDVATLDAEVSGLSSQVNQNTADITALQSSPPTVPRPVIVDANGTEVGLLVDLQTTLNGGSNFFLQVGGN